MLQAYLEAMQSQWSWLIQLTICLESHVKHTMIYHQFFSSCQQCQQELSQHSELLSTRYGQDIVDIDESKTRIQELQEMQEQLSDFDKQIASLVQMSYEIVPLTKRGEVQQSPCRVKCLCTYRQPEVCLGFVYALCLKHFNDFLFHLIFCTNKTIDIDLI